MAVVATLSKGYDLDYIWRQVDRGPAKDAPAITSRPARAAASRQAGGGPRRQGARFEPGQMVERQPYDLLFGQRRASGGTALGRPPGGGRKAADLYARLLAAEPHATAGRKLAAGRPFLTNTYRINKAVAEMFSASKGIHGSPRITV